MVVINIDTAKDSKEEIKQAIAFLQSVVDGEMPSSAETVSDFVNPFAPEEASVEPSNSETTTPFGMFDNPLAETNDAPSTESADASDVESLLASVDEEDDSEESPFSSDAEVVAEDEGDDVYIEIVEYD